MSSIGHFTKTGENFEGTIVTLTINRDVRFVSESGRTNEKSPSHRVFVGEGGGEIGAAWPQRTNDDRPYLSVKLDDPCFTAPVSASLYENEDGSYSLYWSLAADQRRAARLRRRGLRR